MSLIKGWISGGGDLTRGAIGGGQSHPPGSTFSQNPLFSKNKIVSEDFLMSFTFKYVI